MKHNVLKISSATPLPQKTNSFKICAKKGWYGLPVILLLLIMVVVSCNRNTTKQTKTEPEPLSSQDLLKQNNQAIRDSTNKADAEKYWYLNSDNIWLQERARGVGSGGIGFKDSVKITPEELITIYKEHLGYLPDDTFVEVRRHSRKNPVGYDILYDRYYKGVLVKAENLRINIGTDSYVRAVNARFYKDIEKMYQAPLINESEAKEIMLKAFKEKLTFFKDVNLDSLFLTKDGIKFKNFKLQLSPLRNNKFDEANYEYSYFTILSSPSLETLLYKTYLNPITGEIISMDLRSANIRNGIRTQ